MSFFNLKQLSKSFGYAFKGLKHVLLHEESFKIQLFFAFLIIALMLIFDIRFLEKIALIIVITMVLVLELINTILERILDILKPKLHPYAEIIKDIMAGAVLIASIGALIVGVLIFYPYLKEIFAKI